jgi:hypothetical protein
MTHERPEYDSEPPSPYNAFALSIDHLAFDHPSRCYALVLTAHCPRGRPRYLASHVRRLGLGERGLGVRVLNGY